MTDRSYADPNSPPSFGERSTPSHRPADLQTDQHAEGAPEDAVDAQKQAFVEHAEEEAKIAEHNAAAAKERFEKMNETAQPQHDEAAREDKRPRDAFGSIIVQPGDIVVRTGPRNEDMTTTEEDRLIRHKQMVAGHLRNATPDMTGGKGHEDEELDPQTGLSRGHVPEGYQDAATPARGY